MVKKPSAYTKKNTDLIVKIIQKAKIFRVRVSLNIEVLYESAYENV
jgi:hypothetical protein